MDREQDFLIGLVRLLASLDDESYETVASRGLLRRARKEIEKRVPVALSGIEDGAAVIQVGENTVSLPAAGPAGARCTCPAAATCQHILVACLQLPDLIDVAAEDVAEADPINEGSRISSGWLALETKDLRSWCGAESFRKATRFVVDHSPEVSEGKRITVSFTTGIVCHLPPHGTYDSCITNAEPRFQKMYVAAAILALRRHHGFELDGVEAARTAVDRDLLITIQDVVEEYVEVGLQHLSPAASQRLKVLATMCRGSKLYRPGLELESCAQDLDWLLERNAQASTDRLFGRLVQLYALVEALRQDEGAPPRDLTGVGRSRYLERAEMNLVGLGTYPWESDSGYQGVTALFWSPQDKQCFSWSDVRGEDSADGFDPILRFEGAGPWSSACSLRSLSESAFTLKHPHVNAQRRLGSRGSCRTDAERPVKTTDLDSAEDILFSNWTQLREAQRSRRGIGLTRGIPLDGVVLVRPTHWGKGSFDEISQIFQLEIVDDSGDALVLALSYRPLTERAIAFLESFKPVDRSTVLLALHRTKPHEHLWPVSLFDLSSSVEIEAFCFHFAKTKPRKRALGKLDKLIRSKLPLRFIPVPDEMQEEPLDEEIGPLEHLLLPLQSDLLELAERGSHGQIRDQEGKWAAHAVSLERVGLLRLAHSVGNLGAPDSRVARRLLAARYLARLHLDSE